MAYGRKLSLTSNSTSNATVAQPPEAVTLEADFVVVLASLLCAIVCVLGIIVVARCAWMRRGTGGWRFGVGNQLANKGLKKKVLNSLPKYTHKSTEEEEVVVEVEDCAICLAEYVDGDEIRVLPHCGHRFHVECIDTWLGSHSSCPSCRQILAGPRCRNCGEIPTGDGGGGGHDFGKVRPFSSAASTSALIFLP